MVFRTQRSQGTGGAVAGLTLLVLLATTACTTQAPEPTTSPSASQESATATSTAESTATPKPAPSFSKTASTAEALRFFDSVVKKKLDADSGAQGRDIVDALSSAGFSKKNMEVTADSTSIGRQVDSIEVSVRWRGDDCLVGQIGQNGFASTSSPVLKTGKCLIGTTRAIDW